MSESLPQNAEEYRQWWEANTDEPYGYCWCGCGQLTKINTQNTNGQLVIRDTPRQFRKGHYRRPDRIHVCDTGYETPCWLWQGSISDSGHATKSVNGKNLKAYRLYYERYVGLIPEGLSLHHLCEQPSCVNPYHLQPLTNKEHLQLHIVRKMTWARVRALRQLRAETGLSYSALSRRFGISEATVAQIVTHRTWKG